MTSSQPSVELGGDGVFRFFDLPLELRQHIYYYCIPTNFLVAAGPYSYQTNRPRTFRDLRQLKPEERRQDIQDQDGWRPPSSGRNNSNSNSNSSNSNSNSSNSNSNSSNSNSNSNNNNNNNDNNNHATEIWSATTNRAHMVEEKFMEPVGESRPAVETQPEGTPVPLPPYPRTGLDDYSSLWMLGKPVAELYAPPRHSAMPNLLLACHALHNEVTDLMYASNTLLLGCPSSRNWRQSNVWSPETKSKIRKIIMRINPSIFEFSFRKSAVDRQAPRKCVIEPWCDAFRSVKVLGLIVQRDRAGFESHRKFLIDVMKGLDTLLPDTTRIYIDTDEPALVGLVEQMIPHRTYSFQPLNFGDTLFSRRTYDIKHSRWNSVRDYVDHVPF